ncbi:MAG TPA: saccharopine dehydrogenase C-terminal domain-containing protein [Verrucomicrobiae bacterium]|jgi:lysine 6-dehydrogenase|nr:saccharopine dehydrogenase C-terminal domain-containing protein [Verrucomicrobiae bacterium]
MKLLVIGSGMMGSAAALDMARTREVESVTLADSDAKRARDVAARVNRITREKKVHPVTLDASNEKAAARLMRGHNAALSAVPYFLNLGLARAAVQARCHFADLGGNNTVVRQELALSRQAEKRGVAIAPDCGLSPGMASILGGELVRRLGGRADALRLYVGGLPARPTPPFHYQLVFSVEGLINEYVEPARILRKGKLTTIDPLTEPEEFHINGFSPLIAFHTSGGTSTLPETFEGRVGECFEKTLRYPGHYDLLCELKELGLFSSEKLKVGNAEIAPRALMSKIFEGKFASKGPDVCIMRLEAHESVNQAGVRGLLGGRLKGRVASFTMIDHYDPKTDMSAMMRTTAFPASIVVQMLASGAISKRGAVLQECDVNAKLFLDEVEKRGIKIDYSIQ